jgi:hypothetical protein
MLQTGAVDVLMGAGHPDLRYQRAKNFSNRILCHFGDAVLWKL